MGGKRIAVHTQYVFKTKHHSRCLSEEGKILYFSVVLKLLKSVDQEGCDSCGWEGKALSRLIGGKISPSSFSQFNFIHSGTEVTWCHFVT